MNNQDLEKTVDLLSQVHPTLTQLCSQADKQMLLAEKNGKIGSNALYVLRQERELISGEDVLDYIINYPEC